VAAAAAKYKHKTTIIPIVLEILDNYVVEDFFAVQPR